jgi:large subunit ribosomal protein L13
MAPAFTQHHSSNRERIGFVSQTNPNLPPAPTRHLPALQSLPVCTQPKEEETTSPGRTTAVPFDARLHDPLIYLELPVATEEVCLQMKTAIPSLPGIKRDWHVIDADGAVLGRVASQAASILMGKHTARYTPYIDTGDHVVVVNAAKVRLTGNKENQKMYRRHSGYPGGLTETLARTVRETRPTRMVEEAIQGMLPKNKLGKQMYRKLKVYADDKHPHVAQKPAELKAAE